MASCGWFPLSRDEIRAWVEQHRDSLPTTLAELVTFPMPFRKVIVNSVSPEQRARFWEEHLRTFLQPDSELSVDQRAYVAETIQMLPEIFGSPRSEAQAKTRALEARMGELFSRQQCGLMFGLVGPPEPPGGLPLPPDTRLT